LPKLIGVVDTEQLTPFVALTSMVAVAVAAWA
jgi:hypothetical protein